MNKPRLGLIGNPENRRIYDFQKTMEQLGQLAPPCLSYEALLQRPESLKDDDVDLLRIDSPGENASVARELIRRGGGPEKPELSLGEIAWSREYHLGFCEVLREIEKTEIPCLNHPAEIAVMFDKWECHKIFAARGLPRPASELAPPHLDQWREQVRLQKSSRIFLKPLHGSSASGVCALRWTPTHQQLIAPLRIREISGRAALINSLEVCTYSSKVDIDLILSILLPQGMIQEQWIPKLTLPGGAIDLRVLVMAGEARHWVARQSRHPMTNLHLGNKRVEAATILETLGEEKLEAVFRLAEKAASCFSRSLYAGVDILIDHHHRPFIGEINAFGDLLPRLLNRGETAYEAIAKLCYDQCHPV
ncbi:MAG: STM4014 family protein [Verrucomicrobiales bacterium]